MSRVVQGRNSTRLVTGRGVYFIMPPGPGPVLKFCKFNTENNDTLVKTIIFPVQLSNNRRSPAGALIRVQYGTVKGKKQKKIQTEMIESLKI